MTARPKIRQIIVRLTCVMALLMVGFAHKISAFGGGKMPDLSAFALPDGTVPTICTTGFDPDGDKPGKQSCDACRLAAASNLPLPAAIPVQDQARQTVVYAVPAAPDIRRPGRSPTALPRAPPPLPS